jgi:hypothetical protein
VSSTLAGRTCSPTEGEVVRLQRRIADPERREDIGSLLLVVATEETDPARIAHDQVLVLVTDDEELTARAWLMGVTVWTYARFRAHVTESA